MIKQRTLLWLSEPTVHTYVEYANRGCRCDECRADHNRYQKEMRARQRASGGKPRVHGYTAYKNWGCKCEVCTTSMKAYKKAQRERAKARKRGEGTQHE